MASLKYILKKYLKDGPLNGLVSVVYSRSVDGVMRIFFKQFVGFVKITRADTLRINSRKLQHQMETECRSTNTSISFVLIRMTNSSVKRLGKVTK